MAKIAVIVGAVIITILAIVFLFIKPSQESSNQTEPSVEEETSQTSENEFQSATGSLKDLFSLDQNVMCTFDFSDENTSSNGTVYVAGENMYGEFSMTQGEQSFTSNMLRDGQIIYIWSPGKSQGMKMNISEFEVDQETPDEEESAEQKNEALEILENQNVNYDCSPWTVDESKFVLPTNIEFVDFGAQMEALQENIKENLEDVDCSVCDQLPAGDAQSQCKQSLGC